MIQRIKHLHLNFDLSWINWSAYESPVAQIKANLDIRPPKGTTIPLPSAPAPTQIVPPAYQGRRSFPSALLRASRQPVPVG